MKHHSSLILRIGGAILIVALAPAFSSARSQSASIGVTATVAEPLGISEVTEPSGSFIFAPALSTAIVFFETDGIRFSTSARADSSGFVAFDYPSFILNRRTANSTSGINLSDSDTPRTSAPLLTVILTEN